MQRIRTNLGVIAIMIESNNEELELELTIKEQLELQALEASLNEELGSLLEGAPADSNSLSFSEIYASVLLSGEIIITIPADTEEKVKQGLKNLKAKKAFKDREKGLPVESNILSFKSTPSDIEGAIDLSIALLSKNLVPILRLKIPDQTF